MSFWYVEYLREIGDLDEAEKVLNKLVGYGDHLHLFSEEVDVETEEPIGNFPQGITHLGVIRAIYKLNNAKVKLLQK